MDRGNLIADRDATHVAVVVVSAWWLLSIEEDTFFGVVSSSPGFAPPTIGRKRRFRVFLSTNRRRREARTGADNTKEGVFFDGQQPLCRDDYNGNMGSIDISDQISSVHINEHKPNGLFWRRKIDSMEQVSITNTFLLRGNVGQVYQRENRRGVGEDGA